MEETMPKANGIEITDEEAAIAKKCLFMRMIASDTTPEERREANFLFNKIADLEEGKEGDEEGEGDEEDEGDEK